MLVLYRTTGDAKWRDRGWQIWEAIESKTRTFSGYASVYGVDAVNPPPENSMPRYVSFIDSSWFLPTYLRVICKLFPCGNS